MRSSHRLFPEPDFQIFDRLILIEHDGLTTESAINQLKVELRASHNNEQIPEIKQAQSHSNGQCATCEAHRERIGDLLTRVDSLERDKAFLQTRLSDAMDTIKALPAPTPGSHQPLSRWVALRMALLGR